MSRRRKNDPRVEDYKRVRKPMPPPERVEADRRTELEQRRAEREIDEALGEPAADDDLLDEPGGE